MGQILKILALLLVSAWSVSMWMGYFQKKATPQIVTVYVDPQDFEDTGGESSESLIAKPPTSMLSQNFWVWEAKGQLAMVDLLLDDKKLTQYRLNWGQGQGIDVHEMANHLTNIHNISYGLRDHFPKAEIRAIPMRGDANGLYVPSEATLYINNKMQWNNLPFERLVEVILHENMHHIMTQATSYFGENHHLRPDFEALLNAAFFHDQSGMANEVVESQNVNPQELVAYRTQRAARYAGILEANLDAWEMSKRTQEIRVIQRNAGF